jgi:hypothetical protein
MLKLFSRRRNGDDEYRETSIEEQIIMKNFNTITIIFLLVAGLFASAAVSPASTEGSRKEETQSPMRITLDESALSIHTADQLLLSYRYQNVPFKPYVHEFLSPHGINVLRDAPADHLHHHGLMFAVAVDGLNFWEEKQPAGRQQHHSFTNLTAHNHDDHPRATFTEHIHWLNTQNQTLLKEQRTIEIRQPNDPNVTLLTWQAKFEPPPGKEFATLTGRRYYGLGMRFLKSMDTGGTFRNAKGNTGVDGTNNTAACWCAYTAKANGKPVTIAMFDHPRNQRHPATWFTMDQPFAYLSLTMNLHNQPLKVVRDKPLVVCYGVALWDGKVQADRINQTYQRWLAQPLLEKHSSPGQTTPSECKPLPTLAFYNNRLNKHKE